MTDKQQRFCAEFLLDGCCLQAAIRAGYSENGAGQQGSALLKNSDVRKLIDRLRDERNERLAIDGDGVVKRFIDLYYESMCADDLTTAAKCLDSLAKILGCYDKHNRQKQRPVTPAEAEVLRTELEQRGYSWERVNAPESLKRGPGPHRTQQLQVPPYVVNGTNGEH